MAKIGSLTADLTLDSAAFVKGLKEAADATNKNTKQIQQSFEGVTTSIRKVGEFIKLGLGGGALLEFRRIIRDLNEEAIKTSKTYKELGDTFQEAFDKGFGAALDSNLDVSNEKLIEIDKNATAVGGVIGTLWANAISNFNAELSNTQAIMADLRRGDFWHAFVGDPIAQAKENMKDVVNLSAKGGFNDFDKNTTIAAETGIKDLKKAHEEATTAARAHADAESEFKSIFDKTRTPMEAYAEQLKQISALQKAGVGDSETYARMQLMGAASVASSYLGLASQVGGALSSMFEDNKGIAIATAIINTLQGITAALAEYPPPFSFVAAAAQAAMGFAQVAKIKSTSKSSKGTGGGAAGHAAPRPSPPKRQHTGGGGGGGNGEHVILIKGIDPNMHYTGDQVRRLFDAINGNLGNGFSIKGIA